MLTKEPKMLQPDAFCGHTIGYSKMHSGLRYGSAPDPTGGAYSDPYRPRGGAAG